MMTKQQIEDAIEETDRQENMFRMADDMANTAWWILERIRLRALLYARLMEEIR